MTVVMKHAQWLKMTDGGLLQTRSAALKAVDAALLVMGGYTHNRLRQMIFGGVTAHVIRHATIPVLMAH